MKILIITNALALVGLIILSGCGENKKIFTGNKVAVYKDNQQARLKDPSIHDTLAIYEVKQPIFVKVQDKTDYYEFKPNFSYMTKISFVEIIPPATDKLKHGSNAYFPENDKVATTNSLKYGDGKFGLQALTIPLKFRNGIGDGTKNPPLVETGVNINFAPFYKLNYNVFNPDKKFMGKPLATYSISTGALLGLGSADLKAATNSPGLISDRKSGMFTYGTFLMFGVNNINFGYAIGWDNVLGQGSSHWVYQGKMWQGIVIAFDVIK